MTTTINEIRTKFTTQGAGKVAKDTEQVTKAQTRLGQASASSGRQFSAQAQGLGGLVAAYAGAAANVFALQQAFAALQRAAQAETIIQGTKTLALEIGASGDRILKSVQKITQGQLTLAETAQNVNIALSAGFGQKQIEELTDVSLKASRALGRNLTDAFQRVVRGAAKLEPELLDELGIFTRIDPAVQKYANSLNVAVSSLTNYEKRQAFVNAVIEEGQRKFSSIDVSAPSSQKSIERLTTVLTELALEFGQLVNNVLKPFIDFIADNSGIALLAFLGVLRLVFGKAGELIGGFAVGGVRKISDFADGLAAAAEKSKNSGKVIAAGVKELQAAVNQTDAAGKKRGLGGDASFLKGLSRPISTSAAAIRQDFLQGVQLSPAQRKEAIQTLITAQKELEAAGRKGSAAYTDASKIIETYGKAAKEAGIKAKTFSSINTILTASLKGLSVAARIAGAAINSIFLIVSVGQLIGTIFDFDFLKKIKEFFVDTSQAAENFGQGLTGATAAAAGGIDKLTEALKKAGATDDDLENVNDTLKELNQSIRNRGELVARSQQATRPLVQLRGAIARQRQAAGLEVGTKGQAAIAAAAALPTDPLEERGKAAAILAAEKMLQEEKDKGNKADAQRIVLLENLIKSYDQVGFAQEAVGAISRNLGISSDKVAQIFSKVGKVSKDGSLTISELGIQLGVAGQDFAKLDEDIKQSVIDLALFENTLRDAKDSFNAGSTNAETLSKKLVGLVKANDEVNSVYKERGITLDELSENEIAGIVRREKEIYLIRKLVTELKRLETIGSSINKIYGAEIKALDQAIAEGTVGAGGIAGTAEDLARNRAQFLADQVKAALEPDNLDDKQKAKYKDILQLNEAINAGTEKNLKLNAVQVGILQNQEAALKAMAGLRIKLVQDITKAEKEQKKQLATLKAQLEVLKAQEELRVAQRAIEETKATQEKTNKLEEARLSIQKAQLDISKELSSQAEKRFKAEEALINEQQRGLALQREAAASRARAAGTRELTTFDRQIAETQRNISTQNQFGNLFTSEQKREAQQALIDLEFQQQMKVIELKDAQAKREEAEQRKILELKEAALTRELASNSKLISDRQMIALREEEALVIQQELDRAKRQQVIDNLTAEKNALTKQDQVINKQAVLQRIQDEQASEEARARIDALDFQADIINQFIAAVGGDTKFTKAIEAFVGKDLAKEIQEAAAPEKIKKRTDALLAGQNEIDKLMEKSRNQTAGTQRLDVESRRTILETQIQTEKKLAKLEKERQQLELNLLELKNTGTIAEVEQARELLLEKQKNIEFEKENLKLATDERVADLERERAAAKETHKSRTQALAEENDMIKGFMTDVAGVVGGKLKEGVRSFFTAISEGTLTMESFKQGFKDMIVGMLQGIQEKMTERFIDPVIDDLMAGIFGGSDKKIENALVSVSGGSALRVISVGGNQIGASPDNPLSSLFPNGVGQSMEEVGVDEGLFEGAVSSGTDLTAANTALQQSTNTLRSSFQQMELSANPLTSLFGSVAGGLTDFGSSLFSMAGSLLGSFGGGGQEGSGVLGLLGTIGKSVMSVFSPAATGGIVHMAAGGMMRDRVPALLEPGEFVIRKPMAKAIGGPALNAMNSTGAMPVGNVVVNIENKGTPQDAEAKQPRFDGEKFVIDIVTRDLRNNGPIRKSMRGDR